MRQRAEHKNNITLVSLLLKLRPVEHSRNWKIAISTIYEKKETITLNILIKINTRTCINIANI